MDATKGTKRRASRLVVAAAATFTLTAAGVTVAFAAGGFTDSTGHINACVDKLVGTVRVVQPGTACKVTETPLVWNQQGPTGPTGPVGPAGGAGQMLVSYQDPSSYDEATNGEVTPANPTIQLASGPSFTLAAPTFVQVMGYGRMSSTDANGGYGTCNGGAPGGFGPQLTLLIDGQLGAFSSTGLNLGPALTERADATTFRLPAGTHAITWQYQPSDCSTSPTGTTHVDQLSASVVAYN